jgi:hypothetical protein
MAMAQYMARFAEVAMQKRNYPPDADAESWRK